MSQQNNPSPQITEILPIVEDSSDFLRFNFPIVINDDVQHDVKRLLKIHNYYHGEKETRFSFLREPLKDFSEFLQHEATKRDIIELIFRYKRKRPYLLVISTQAERFYDQHAPEKVWKNFIEEPFVLLVDDMFSHCYPESIDGGDGGYDLTLCLDKNHMQTQLLSGEQLGASLQALFPQMTQSGDKECFFFQIPIGAIIQINLK